MRHPDDGDPNTPIRVTCHATAHVVVWASTHAQHPGQRIWGSDPIEVVWPPDPQFGSRDTSVVVPLRPFPNLRIRVQDSDGQAARGAEVRLILYRRSRADDLVVPEIERERRGDMAFGRIVRASGTVIHIHYDGGQGDDAGEITLPIPISDPATAAVFHVGHRPRRVDLGALDRDREEVVTLEASEPGLRAEVYWGDVALGSRAITIHDVTTDRQFTVAVRTDASGVMPTEWLEKGRLYGIVTSGEEIPSGVFGGGYLRWDGRTRIDLEQLPRLLADLIGGGSGKATGSVTLFSRRDSQSGLPPSGSGAPNFVRRRVIGQPRTPWKKSD